MRPVLLLCLALCLCAATAAHADTIDVFNFSGTPVANNDTNTLSGSLTIDITSGIVDAAALTSGSISLSGVLSQSGPVIFIGTSAASGKFSGDAGSYINYNGGAFDLSGLRANEDFVGHVTLGSSTTSSFATPEPPAILLTGTALILAAFFLRGRPLTAH